MEEILDLFHSKSQFCNHQHGCIISAFKLAIKNLKYGLIISLALQLVAILKRALKNRSLIKSSFQPQYLSIPLFLSAIGLVLRLVKCTLRRIRDKDDGWNSLLAGAAGGWVASKTLSKDYWYFYLTFIGSRIIGAFHKYLIKKEVLNGNNSIWHSIFMMAIAHSIHSYGYFLHPYILKDDIYGLYKEMSALTPSQKKWHLSALKYSHRRMIQRFGKMPQYDKIVESKMGLLEQSILNDKLCNHK